VRRRAVRDLPEDPLRYHTCHGLNFGPRASDLQLADVIDILFKIHAGAGPSSPPLAKGARLASERLW
jgi:hypothetical protein